LLKNSFLFISSNIFYFLAILFTYFDLRQFTIATTVYPTQFSFTTYAIIIVFLTNLFLLYINEASNKFNVFNIFIYYLIISAGIYVLNFPLMDELILIITAFFSFINLFIKKNYIHKSIYFVVLILFILFLQSIIGFLFDIRSIRYFVMFPCLIIVFLYFSNLQEIDDNKQKIFFNYIFYAILVYSVYQIFFWLLKFYIFDMKFIGQNFIGYMQPSYALSASGHFDSIFILSGFLVLYFLGKSGYHIKSSLLLLFMFSFWILADARSTLFIISLVITFYFLLLNFYKKIIFILVFIFIILQSNYFDNSINELIGRTQNTAVDLFSFDSGTKTSAPVFKLEGEGYFYESKEMPVYQDFGRLTFIISSVESIKYNFHKILFGCGFYGYYHCTDEARTKIFNKYDVALPENNRGFGNSKIRPPAFPTFIVENGLIVMFMGLVYYLRSLKKCIYFKNDKLFIKKNRFVLLLYLLTAFLGWSFIANIFDIIFVYLFLMPSFRKYLFYRV